MSKLANKVALVTGGSRGIRAAIAKRLAADADVVAFIVSDAARWITRASIAVDSGSKL
jgi:3-oxoacyl-[acyl-carrier protein] reductase